MNTETNQGRIESIKDSIRIEFAQLNSSSREVNLRRAFLRFSSILLESGINKYTKYDDLLNDNSLEDIFKGTEIDIENTQLMANSVNTVFRNVVFGTDTNRGAIGINYAPYVLHSFENSGKGKNNLMLVSNLGEFPNLYNLGSEFRNRRTMERVLPDVIMNIRALIFTLFEDHLEYGKIIRNYKTGGRFPKEKSINISQEEFSSHVVKTFIEKFGYNRIFQVEQDLLFENIIPVATLVPKSKENEMPVSIYSKPYISFEEL